MSSRSSLRRAGSHQKCLAALLLILVLLPHDCDSFSIACLGNLKCSQYCKQQSPCRGKRSCLTGIRRYSGVINDVNEQAFAEGKKSAPRRSNHVFERRIFLSTFAAASLGVVSPPPCFAGDLGNRINAAVTQSDFGVSVRRSVVKGAQVMDKLDGKWEKFSDDFGLGAERSKRDARPTPKEIPDLLPLDAKTALSILDAADLVFLSLVPVEEADLRDQIKKVDSLVRKSFERSGISMEEGSTLTAPQFNYYCYVHFKAFNDLLIERKVNFAKFRRAFENELGGTLVKILVPEPSLDAEPQATPATADPDTLKTQLASALAAVDDITTCLRSKGLVALVEKSELDKEREDDWAQDLSDLQFSIALDGDVTQNSQILLQEQGFRLHPDFARFAITSALQKSLSQYKQDIASDEYYMDTSYSSDPDLFEVKQILLNVVIESSAD